MCAGPNALRAFCKKSKNLIFSCFLGTVPSQTPTIPKRTCEVPESKRNAVEISEEHRRHGPWAGHIPLGAQCPWA